MPFYAKPGMGGGASTDRIQALHNQIFNELDINSDGVLDRKELEMPVMMILQS